MLVFLVLTLGVTAGLVLPLLRKKQDHSPEKRDIAVYREQLAEVDNDIARGLLTKSQAEAIRTEIHRRMLAVVEAAPASTPVSRRTRKTIVVLIAVLLPVLTFMLYIMLGSPDLPGRANNAAAWSKTGESIVLAHNGVVVIEALEDFNKALKLDPRDARARFYTGLAEAQINNFKKAISIWKGVLKDSAADAPWAAMIKDHIKVYAQKGGFDPASIAPSIKIEN